MNREEFMREQYLTLREEIRETKDRIFKIVAIGLFVGPAGHYLARTMDAQLVLLFLPLLVLSVALLYLAENHSLMRCGRYIRLHIESEIPNLEAWEEWLESRDVSEPRNVDRFVTYAIYLILGAYYTASVVAAFRYATVTYGRPIGELLLGVYGGLAVVSVFFMLKNMRSTTATLSDVPSKKALQTGVPAQPGASPDAPKEARR